MSMFYELMMRKKEQIMYATIKGSLTESPEGVFSGFSASNYLQLQKFIDYNSASSWEIKITFTTGSDVNTSQALYHDSWSNGGVYINIVTNRIRLYINFGDGDFYGYPSGTILANTKYYCRFLFTGTQYKILLSTDDVNWIDYFVRDESKKVANQSASLGRIGVSNRFSSQSFLGSIDLNNSYIKIGSTKYNLQAVVGYTIVGSPTITDGVVSGFTTSDYIYIPKFPYTKNWSITIKANTTATGETQRCLYRSVNFQLRVNTINIWEIYASGVNKSLGQSPTSYPYVRVEKENSYISAYISQDGKTYSKVAENINAGSVTNGSLSFSSDGAIWSGSIDLNETYIKVNGKLWFNGQPA